MASRVSSSTMASRAPWSAMASRVSSSTMASRAPWSAMAVGVPRPALEASPESLPISSLQGAHPPSPVLLLRGRTRLPGGGGTVTDLPVLLPFQSQRTPSPGFTYHWLSSPASSVESTSYTCNHLPLPFISSLTSVTHRLVSRLHGSLHWSMPTSLPVHPGTRLCLWKCKFTNSWYCSSCFQYILRCLSNVGSPALVIVNKLPFDLHLPVCLLDQYCDSGSTRWNCVPISCRHALCFNGRGRAPVPICKHFCSHMWPQLPANPLLVVLWTMPLSTFQGLLSEKFWKNCPVRCAVQALSQLLYLILWPELPPAWT